MTLVCELSWCQIVFEESSGRHRIHVYLYYQRKMYTNGRLMTTGKINIIPLKEYFTFGFFVPYFRKLLNVETTDYFSLGHELVKLQMYTTMIRLCSHLSWRLHIESLLIVPSWPSLPSKRLKPQWNFNIHHYNWYSPVAYIMNGSHGAYVNRALYLLNCIIKKHLVV